MGILGESYHNECTKIFALKQIPENLFHPLIMVDTLNNVIDQRRTLDELWRTVGHRRTRLRFFGVKLLALAEKFALMCSHFLSPPRIAELLGYSNGKVYIEMSARSVKAWVIAEKVEQP